MFLSEVSNVLVTEFSKIADKILIYSIIFAVAIIVLGLIIGSIKKTIRKIFK